MQFARPRPAPRWRRTPPAARGLVLATACSVLGSLGAPACSDRAPSDPLRLRQATLAKAWRARQQGDYAGAMKTLKRALARSPDDPELLNRFALAARLAYDATGRMDYRDEELVALRKARRALGRYLLPESLRVDVWTNLGTTLWEMGMPDEAAAAYRAVLRLAPHHPDAREIWRRIRRAESAPKEDEIRN